jgi:hypothetical protein
LQLKGVAGLYDSIIPASVGKSIVVKFSWSVGNLIQSKQATGLLSIRGIVLVDIFILFGGINALLIAFFD